MRPRTRLILMIVGGLILLMVAAASVASHYLKTQEISYQTGADAKRRNDVLKIADLLQEYKAATGHYPYVDRPPDPPHGKVAYSALIAAPAAEQTLRAHPERWAFGLKLHTVYARDLVDLLSTGLGRPIRLPVDPQQISTGAPNAYVVYFINDDAFLITAHLYFPTPSTAPQPAGGNLYAVASENPGGFLSGIGLRARALDSITAQEKAATQAAAVGPEARFARYVALDTDGR